MQEIWKDIPQYEGVYQVSNLGRVKSLKFNKERILKTGSNGDGYLMVCFNKDMNQKTFKVHQLVAIAFLNHKPDGTLNIVVDHIDNNKLNNNVENLQLTTNRHNASKDKKNTSSKYTGVSWCKKSKKWTARIRVNRKQKYLGCFNCETEASKAYQEELKKLL